MELLHSCEDEVVSGAQQIAIVADHGGRQIRNTTLKQCRDIPEG